jgi:Tfp pilus assembly protein PilV
VSGRAAPARRRIRRREGGFTLVEVFIALSVFAVGVLVLALIIPLGIKKSNSASQQSRASQLATIRAEAILDAAYAEPDLDDGTHYDAGNPILGQYYVEWVVEADQPITDCKRITVNVRRPTSTSPIEARVVLLKAKSET